jgi:hypothetical protein
MQTGHLPVVDTSDSFCTVRRIGRPPPPKHSPDSRCLIGSGSLGLRGARPRGDGARSGERHAEPRASSGRREAQPFKAMRLGALQSSVAARTPGCPPRQESRSRATSARSASSPFVVAGVTSTFIAPCITARQPAPCMNSTRSSKTEGSSSSMSTAKPTLHSSGGYRKRRPVYSVPLRSNQVLRLNYRGRATQSPAFLARLGRPLGRGVRSHQG